MRAKLTDANIPKNADTKFGFPRFPIIALKELSARSGLYPKTSEKLNKILINPIEARKIHTIFISRLFLRDEAASIQIASAKYVRNPLFLENTPNHICILGAPEKISEFESARRNTKRVK